MINDIRIAPNELYGIKMPLPNQNEKSDIDFSQIMNQDKEDNKQNGINFASLGAPAGFFADISMLNESDAKEIGIISF